MYNPPNPQYIPANQSYVVPANQYYVSPSNQPYNPSPQPLTQQPVYTQPPTNPSAINTNATPGTLVIYSNANNNNISNNNNNNNNNNNGGSSSNNDPTPQENNTGVRTSVTEKTEKAKEFAIDKGLKALSWVTTKVNNLNDKLNNPEGKQQ